MKRIHCGFLALLIALLAVLPAQAENAKSLYKKGQQAEARQNYEEAYGYFKQAYDKAPENTDFRVAFQRTRFLASASHVHRGQMLRQGGQLTEALKEFQAAAMIDPSNAIAGQEIQATRRMIEQGQQPAEETPGGAGPQSGIGTPTPGLAGPVQLAPISQTPLTLKLSEDSKTVYETIGKLAGINVLFDPDYNSRRITIELNSVSLEQALQIVALQSRTFWRPVTPNTIYVAADTQQKRTELEQQVLRTFYLSNFSTVAELQDVANLIRTILRVERVQQFPAENAIVMRGTPDQAALAQLLINNLDKAKPEVVVDVVVMQVSKNKLKQLGIQYPFQGGTKNPTVTIQSPGTTSSSSSSSSSTSGTSTSGLTLNNLANLDATDFAVSIPSMSVAFLMNDSDTRVLQEPQIRSVDGQKATLKIGERIPIAIGTSSSTLTATALTQTQFQYQDVGVNIEMTPHILASGDVNMKISLEVSNIDGYQTIGGLTEPVIGQRKIDHEISVRDGEVSLIGGMMEHDDVRNMSGLPWVSQVPVLKYLFGQGQKTKTDTETVFALVPHVVRRLDVNDLSLKPVDIGTQNVVSVRHLPTSAPVEMAPAQPVPSGVPTPAPAPPSLAAPATPAPGSSETPNPQGTPAPSAEPLLAPAAPAAPGPMASAKPPAAGTPARSAGFGPVLSLDPPMVNQPAGATFAVSVILNGGQNVVSVPVRVNYDPKVMRFLSVTESGALSRDGAAVAMVHRDDAANGVLQVSLMRPPGSGGISPSGALFTITFMAKAAGQGVVSIDQAVLRDPNNYGVQAGGSQAIVNVR
jgi:general secretion pathway protein D